jgi:uncharacterized protein (TIGR03118 family)
MTRLMSFAAILISVCVAVSRADAATYVQTDLVSDIPNFATLTDPELQNSWGLTFRGASPFWISDQGTGVSTLYNVTGSLNVTKAMPGGTNGNITIPTTASGPQGPTGTVSNSNLGAFAVSMSSGGNGNAANFIFANLNGTISAWNAGQTAFVQTTTPGASYTGLAINQAQNQLYAVNNAAGTIDVFNSSFTKMSLGSNAFATPAAITALGLGLVPFNVQDIGGNVYVTYAPAGHAAQTGAAQGAGAVAVFNESGTLLPQPLILGGTLAAPWGVALAPSSFGQFGGDLLVGNFSFSNSFISAFDPTTGVLKGMIPIDVDGQNPGGLWALMFGSSGGNGSPNTLFFTDGINGEADGLFGAITPTPLPAALPLFATGLGGLGLLGWRRKRKAQAGLS